MRQPELTQTVLVTGAGGFIGRHLIKALDATGYNTIAQSKSGHALPANRLVTDEAEVNLAEVDCIIHLAGLAHAGAQSASRESMMRINVEASRALYARALAARVPRFIWLSSIKVLGNRAIEPLSPTAPYDPKDDYALSKVQAEQALLSEGGGASLAIVRPPIVYGPGVKANFLRLLQWADRGLPLPLGRATAPRAWVAVDNLISLLLVLIAHQGNETVWHVRDLEETSVSSILRRMMSLCGHPDRLVNVPVGVIGALAGWVGRSEDVERLFSPLRVDMERTQRSLDWCPPLTQASAIQEVVRWYRARS